MRSSIAQRVSALMIALSALVFASGACGAPGPARDGEFRLALWPSGARSPDFRLSDFNGQPRTMADYRGRIVVIFFGFLTCPEACPAALLKLSLMMKQLGPTSSRVQVLFVTLDPERDSRAALKSYVVRFDPRFIALTGSTAQIDLAAARFDVQYARVALGNDYTIDHSTATFVFDAAGRLRLLGASDTKMGDFVHDIEVLAAEPQSDSIG